ncbi:BOLA class I histocompatibility antigen, alpha chain BL3-7-like isoform X2 [Anabas testudineus]|uniref:BOLA class I histocompatibility antigen, alpha chain BL3-7-like isoform X2 n=1 Tax=Anabas testudineus TaxID=64144 RepID=UPI00143DBB26|nr:BOLA class I histocompatibility antigen, alpha chain BL3-7-like isoform X2 [Anabas testudineus]
MFILNLHMMKMFLLLLFGQVTSPGKHSLKFYLTASSGVSAFPDFVAVAKLNEVELAYYDSSIKRTELKQDWMIRLLGDDPHRSDRTKQNCMNYHKVFKEETDTFKKRFNQTGGVCVVQEMAGCEWDDETGDVTGYQQYGYDGEDFISLDLKTETWVAPKPQAVITKHKWDGDKARNVFWKNFVTQSCIEKLKRYLINGKSSLQRTVLPSVSLLQKTPSSPVSCHATGFYPDRASMFWRKDGEEIHEDVDHGEILPNHDGTFLMRVDLNISSVKPEDWSRYDCVFQFSGVKKDVITKLDKAEIRTNWGKSWTRNNEVPPSEFPAAVIGVVVGLLLLLVCITGLFIWRKKKNGFKRANTSDSSDKNPRHNNGNKDELNDHSSQ